MIQQSIDMVMWWLASLYAASLVISIFTVDPIVNAVTQCTVDTECTEDNETCVVESNEGCTCQPEADNQTPCPVNDIESLTSPASSANKDCLDNTDCSTANYTCVYVQDYKCRCELKAANQTSCEVGRFIEMFPPVDFTGTASTSMTAAILLFCVLPICCITICCVGIAVLIYCLVKNKRR